MADTKITALAAITTVAPANDLFAIVDVSDNSMAASGTTKNITTNQILGAGGTATLASATITGALGAAGLNVTGSTIPANGVYLGSANNLSFSAASALGMTLNSTGLGVGVTPSAGKFEVQESGTGSGIGGIFTSTVSGGGNPGVVFRTASTNRWSLSLTGSAGAESIRFYDINNSATRLLIDTSGNVGIGVTPNSLWAIGKVLQIGSASGSFLYGSGGQSIAGVNAYYDTAWKYAANGRANYYQQSSGIHSWFYDSGTQVAGTAANFVQAMTLDASGNLLVGKTAASVTTIGFQTLANGEASVAMAASTSASSTLNVWSTGAGAYRFYVAMNGTISATNTTISAISDARLKENVQDIDVGLGAILALKPRKFDWKAGKGKDIKGDRGFIAQEFEQVFPNLIDEWKDPAPEGEAPYKSVRQDLIPVLVKAIQELTARVQTLETR